MTNCLWNQPLSRSAPVISAHPYRDRPSDMPVPNALNVVLVGLVVVTALTLLWVGSRVEAWYATLGIGILFSYVLLTNYALLHEASHQNLSSNSRLNWA